MKLDMVIDQLELITYWIILISLQVILTKLNDAVTRDSSDLAVSVSIVAIVVIMCIIIIKVWHITIWNDIPRNQQTNQPVISAYHQTKKLQTLPN